MTDLVLSCPCQEHVVVDLKAQGGRHCSLGVCKLQTKFYLY